MKFDNKNNGWKFGEYSYSVDNGLFKKAYTKKAGYKTKITVIAFISVLIFILYPFDLEGTAGIKNLTAEDISSISLNQVIVIPKGMDIENQDISMEDIAEKIKELRPLPLSEYSEDHVISMEAITDKRFIEEVLITLSNHKMRKRRFSRGVDFFPMDYTMPSSTRLSIYINDSNKTLVNIFISHNPQYVSIHKYSNINGNSKTARYKIYGDGIDTQRLFELTK
ncbi:hypothetical protein F8154_01030 [Alkaliphilus pronyensis]|uniref:Uncharacterized protein n=1 Tax=Alkaliphilus pronyensis TaxID=1482732 RepID=A0A6I0FII2_9FIRM|nr:hypothetical protein [Alkaliphilus pronyensis]KAB3539046.1 hypothetical protein F8154_01030 [Alkaliphilus pronyensis]